MKILLAAVNASYSHTNLAARCLCSYVKKYNSSAQIDFAEWTINQTHTEILQGIYSYLPDLLLFPTYIWNAAMVTELIQDVKKILPSCVIGAGGPEFGYYPEGYLEKLKELDFVSTGEGEKTTLELSSAPDFLPETLEKIKGIYYRKENEICFSGHRELISDMRELPFPYPEITEPDTRIYYYESSRGCPFSCAYCISSIERSVRFMPLNRVFEDLQRFLDAKVKLVKFVDRTYNLNENRYIDIWKYIVNNHNGKTMFHFEIEAEFLSEKALEFLQTVPEGIMQFEMGLQSANKETLKAVNRSDNIELLASNIRQIPKTIHQHLDLIAGLPHEDLESFGKSFDFAMALKPDMLQLGFLKVLHGTKMEDYAKSNGWQWMKNPVYETFSTPHMSYKDMVFLKHLETLLDAYWNSGSFSATMEYIGNKQGFWTFFSNLTKQAESENIFEMQRRELFWFEYLASKCNETEKELLRFDFIKSTKKSNFPDWYSRENYSKENHRLALEENGGITNARMDFAYSDYDEFNVNPFKPLECNLLEKTKVLFFYARRDGTGSNRQILL